MLLLYIIVGKSIAGIRAKTVKVVQFNDETRHDVVLCQHSHCIGCYEQYENGHILYGQENFHFVTAEYMQNIEFSNTGILVIIDFTEKCKLEFIPTVVEKNGIRIANKEEKIKILNEMALRNKSLQDGSWKGMWYEFCEKLSIYKFIPKEKEELFSHFIDCEAHLDVLKEIYPTWHKTNK